MSGFAKFAEGMTNPAKRRIRIARTRKEKREKEKLEEAVLFKMWEDWHQEYKKKLLAGPHARMAKDLIYFLERMTIDNGDILIKHAARWKDVDYNTRCTVLSIISARCVLVRERNGLPPFDDDLEDPPITSFLQIRRILMPENETIG